MSRARTIAVHLMFGAMDGVSRIRDRAEVLVNPSHFFFKTRLGGWIGTVLVAGAGIFGDGESA